MEPIIVALFATLIYALGVATGALVVAIYERSRPSVSYTSGSHGSFSALKIAPTAQSNIESEAKKIEEREVFVPTKEGRAYYEATRQRPRP